MTSSGRIKRRRCLYQRGKSSARDIYIKREKNEIHFDDSLTTILIVCENIK